MTLGQLQAQNVSASVAIVSPGMTTRPTETGTLSTRPAAGARTRRILIVLGSTLVVFLAP